MIGCRSAVLGYAVLGQVLLGTACPPPTTEPTDASTLRDASIVDVAAQDARALDAAGQDLAPVDTAAADQQVADAAGQDRSGVDGGSCSSAEACPAGQGCFQEHCGACHGGADCRASLREGCDNGVCGACTTAAMCDDGLGCRAITGECHACRVAQECRAGQGCVDGVCEACSEAAHCSGGLCSTANACVACVPATDDQACRDAYGDPAFACQADGTCAPTTCVAGTDCQLVQRVCSMSGTCVACEAAADCLDSLHGGYAAGTLCVSGRCVEANCLGSDDCPVDRPVCGSDSRCRACQATAECLAREGVAAGYICDVDTGRCQAGNCYPTDQPCSTPSNGVCEAYTCRACANDAVATLDDCQQHGYQSSVLCVAGACVLAECNDVVDCALGRVCDDSACVDCTAADDSYCQDQGMTCNTGTRNCVGCTADAQCSGGARICDDLECRDCLPGECGTGRVCADGACVAGDCYIDGQLWDNLDANPYNICSRCNQVNTAFAWSPNIGVGCDDGNDCSYGDTCSSNLAGICASQTYSCSGNTCADGVCHGTGSADCTLEKKESWGGCFIDGVCYAHLEDNPANACQFCSGATGEWVDRVEGTGCGTCRTCQRPASTILCDFVEAGQDPNDDCTQSCQVCNGSGGCRWLNVSADPDHDPNGDCPSTPQLTCSTTGDCAGGSDQCAYWTGVDGVSDNNECTSNDRCDGLGHKIGDPLTGTWCLQDTKVCRSGTCSDCLTGECPVGRVCNDGSCVVGTCTDPDDCGTPLQCKAYTCPANQCIEQGVSVGSCVDGDPCTVGDSCLNGDCDPGTGTQNCTGQDDSCNVGVCRPLDPDNYLCEKAPLAAGTGCDDDGHACTVDLCEGPDGSPRSCAFDHYQSGTCFIADVCYDQNDLSATGCGYCNSTSPTSWTPVAVNTECGTNACPEVCSGTSCVGRWYKPFRNCMGGYSGCIIDRKTAKTYYYIVDASSCPVWKNWADAADACKGLLDVARLPTLAEYLEIYGPTGCTNSDCSGDSMRVVPPIAGYMKRGKAYWTGDSAGTGLKKMIQFNSNSYSTFDYGNLGIAFPFLCVSK